jgi:hypothetical protein
LTVFSSHFPPYKKTVLLKGSNECNLEVFQNFGLWGGVVGINVCTFELSYFFFFIMEQLFKAAKSLHISNQNKAIEFSIWTWCCQSILFALETIVSRVNEVQKLHTGSENMWGQLNLVNTDSNVIQMPKNSENCKELEPILIITFK